MEDTGCRRTIEESGSSYALVHVGTRFRWSLLLKNIVSNNPGITADSRGFLVESRLAYHTAVMYCRTSRVGVWIHRFGTPTMFSVVVLPYTRAA